MTEPNIVQLNRTEFPDSLEIGTPSKGGTMKVYFNASNAAETKLRIDNAKEALKYAQLQVTTS